MNQDVTFSYNYSAKENKEVQDIRRKYLPQNKSSIEELKEMDAKVKRPANIFAWIIGCISAIVMGCGMSLIMTDIGSYLGIDSTMLPGILIGIIGLFLAVINYPIYKSILSTRRRKYAERIIALSDKIMEGQGEQTWQNF